MGHHSGISEAMRVIILQPVSVSNQHIVYLQLPQHSMSILFQLSWSISEIKKVF